LPLRRRRHRRAEGQSLAEFALVFPFFLIVLFGIIEFGFALNAYLSIDFGSREAALAAAEAGNDSNADCAILRSVERSIGAPASINLVQSVRIYKAQSNGDPLGGASPTIYSRTGSMSCPLEDGTPATLPYTRTANGYPPASRCNILAGCTGSTTASVDTIGVEIRYRYVVKTPLYSLMNANGNGWTMIKSNAMRMEPVL
jgi:Flp pilus assembly protein TadG